MSQPEALLSEEHLCGRGRPCEQDEHREPLCQVGIACGAFLRRRPAHQRRRHGRMQRQQAQLRQQLRNGRLQYVAFKVLVCNKERGQVMILCRINVHQRGAHEVRYEGHDLAPMPKPALPT